MHKFLATMFKDKMETEMKKFSVVEEAFSRLKLATGITEMPHIVEKVSLIKSKFIENHSKLIITFFIIVFKS